MTLQRIDTPADRIAALTKLGCDPAGGKILAAKMETMLFRIRGLSAGAANILKQDAIAVGADLALPAGAVCCAQNEYEAILMGTPRQLKRLARKERAQPFGLAALGEALAGFLRSDTYGLKIMGVINANDDSFYPQSRFKASEAIAAVERMIEEGADIIDIGGVSSRPGSDPVSPREEMARVAPLLEAIGRERLYERVVFSIDSYEPTVIARALENGFKIVNDITGLADPEVGRLAASYGAKLVIMHMQGTPKTMQEAPFYEDVVLDVDRFFVERLERASEVGLDRDAVILDVGIGFGKRLEHNLALLKHMAHFTRFGCELLVGASRKSMIDALYPSKVEARLPGTLAIHMQAVRRGASIVRCHDVAAHVQAFTLYRAIEEAE